MKKTSSVYPSGVVEMDISFQVLLLVTVVCNNAVTAAPRQKRLSLAAQMPSYYFTNIDGHPGTYSFGYDVLDPATGNTQFRSEEKYPNGTVVGSYGYVDPNGRMRRFNYVADKNGYRILNEAPHEQNYIDVSNVRESVQTEPSVSWTRPRKTNKKKVQSTPKSPSELIELPYQD